MGDETLFQIPGPGSVPRLATDSLCWKTVEDDNIYTPRTYIIVSLFYDFLPIDIFCNPNSDSSSPRLIPESLAALQLLIHCDWRVECAQVSIQYNLTEEMVYKAYY